MAEKSPSPNPRRTPERSHSLRKSKETPQRSSLTRPSLPSSRVSFELKENVRLRSPSVSKGSKNFMAPTISASSKAVAPSPRKKILQESNEVMNSISDYLEFPVKDGGVSIGNEEYGPESDEGFEHQEEVFGCGEVKKGESRIKNHQNVVFPRIPPLPVIPPLDADPSLPPYDPKTNYLSPRPQFLRYRPNPRIEQYLNREEELLDVEYGRQLEESFSSESSEDDVTAGTEETDWESDSCLIQLEKVEKVESKGFEVESCPIEVEKIKQVEKDLEGEPCLMEVQKVESKGFEVESCPVEVEKIEQVESKDLEGEPCPMEVNKVESSREILVAEPIKRQHLRRSKLLPFFFVLAVAFLYVPLSDSPINSSSTLKYQFLKNSYIPSSGVRWGFHHPKYYLSSANVSFHGLGSRLRDWSADSFTFFAFGPSSSFKDDVGLYHVVNMTSSAMDEFICSDPSYKRQSRAEQVVNAAAESDTELVAKAAAEFDTELETESGIDQVAKAAADSETEQVAKAAAEFYNEQAAEPETEEVGNAVAEPETEEVAEAVADSETVQVVKGAAEPETEQVVKAAAEFYNEQAAEPETEEVAKAAAEPETKQVVKGAADSETEQVVKDAAVPETVQAIKDNGEEQFSFAIDGLEVFSIRIETDAEYTEDMEMGMLGENAEMVVEVTAKETEIEMVVAEDEKEDDFFAQTMEVKVFEGVKQTDNMGYEIEKDVSEDNWIDEPEDEASHPRNEAPHVVKDVAILEMVEAEISRDEETEMCEPEIIESVEECSTDDSINRTQSATSVDSQSDFPDERKISHVFDLTGYCTVLGLSALLLAVAATLISLYEKQKQILMGQKKTRAIKKVGSISGSNMTHIHAKRSPCYNLYGNKGMASDSDPAEVSSSWNNAPSSGRHHTERDKEAQNLSHERTTRRDSTASSTSYGSFTTYERLTARKGGRDEEVITPVRRSSRIRNTVILT